MNEYYKAAPSPPVSDPAVWAMAAPLCIYSVGIVLYGADAFTVETHAAVTLGSWLMIVGGEANSLMTAIETYRKNQAETASIWDWLALVVSMCATMGTLFVTYTKVNAVQAPWYTWAVTFGPLLLLLASVTDATLSGAQVGSRIATYEERFEVWQVARHNWELAQERRSVAQVAPQPPQVAETSAPVAEVTTPEFEHNATSRAILEAFAQDAHATRTAVAQAAGVSRTTVANYLKAMQLAGIIHANGNGVEVLT